MFTIRRKYDHKDIVNAIEESPSYFIVEGLGIVSKDFYERVPAEYWIDVTAEIDEVHDTVHFKGNSANRDAITHKSKVIAHLVCGGEYKVLKYFDTSKDTCYLQVLRLIKP